jgi:tetratricopeptide (TPR) repeat protein
MPRLVSLPRDFRVAQPWLIGVPIVLVAALLLALMLRPDVAAGHFRRAQSLQSAGQLQRALRLYELIVETQPNSSYAPLALQQQGEILTALARQNGDTDLFRQALSAYDHLSQQYSNHSAAGQALMEAGNIALNDLRNTKIATRFYQKLLDEYPSNADYTSEALLRLGRIALLDGDGKKSQMLLGRVLKDYSRFPDRAAEAQYHQGVVLETLLKNKSMARSAYEATIKQWPRSVWAADAKERLGMMVYSDSRSTRPARRVVLQVGALPPLKGDSLSAALRLALAAHGLEISDAVWRGWSLAPFRTGFFPASPENALAHDDDGWRTVAANAGLVYSQRSFPNAARALDVLRDELDAGHMPLLNISGWQLAAGYDSVRDEVSLRGTNTDVQTLSVKELAAKWRVHGEYNLLIFEVPGGRLRADVKKTTDTPEAPALLAPSYLYKLPRLAINDGHRRTIRRAAALMQRPREGGWLLNLEALRAVRMELENLSQTPDQPDSTFEGTARDDSETPSSSATPSAITPNRQNGTAKQDIERWKKLRLWFNAPLGQWIESRRDAAAYLDAAAHDLGDARLQSAAEDLRTAMSTMKSIASTLPPEDAFANDPTSTRHTLQAIAEKITVALDAEKSATNAMNG